MDTIAYFEASGSSDVGGTYSPLPIAEGMWGKGQMHGVAISGLMARTLEQYVHSIGRGDLVPVRYHVDLFTKASMIESTVEVRVIREGPRIVTADVAFTQEGTVVARASAVFLKQGSTPSGAVWSAPDELRATPPSTEICPETSELRLPFFASAKPWSDFFGDHQNDGRHATWQTPVPVVAGEEMTPFQAAAAIADCTNMVTNWGDAGVEYINTDISLAMCRPPVGVEIGLRAIDHVSADGIAVGTAELFDRAGTLGTTTVTALANAKRTVDLAEQPRHTRVIEV